jgi:hypothetical protein
MRMSGKTWILRSLLISPKNPHQNGMGLLILTESKNYSALGASAAGSSKPYLLRKRSTRPSVSIIF